MFCKVEIARLCLLVISAGTSKRVAVAGFACFLFFREKMYISLSSFGFSSLNSSGEIERCVACWREDTASPRGDIFHRENGSPCGVSTVYPACREGKTIRRIRKSALSGTQVGQGIRARPWLCMVGREWKASVAILEEIPSDTRNPRLKTLPGTRLCR